MRLLHRLGIGPDRVEVDELAVELRLVFRPDLLHGEDALAEQAPALLEVGPVVFHLLPVPAPADPEDEAPPRQQVEAGNLLGEGDGVALDHQADPRREPEARRRGRGAGQRHEWIEGVPVFLRQVRAARPRTLAALGDVGVLGQKERLEASFLRGPRQLIHPDRVIRREDI